MRRSQPWPPPSVRPAIPVLETMPPGAASPKSLGLAIEIRPGRPALGPDGAAPWIDPDPPHRRQVDHQTLRRRSRTRRRCALRRAPPAAGRGRRRTGRRRRRRPRRGTGRPGPAAGRSCRSRPGAPRRRSDHPVGSTRPGASPAKSSTATGSSVGEVVAVMVSLLIGLPTLTPDMVRSATDSPRHVREVPGIRFAPGHEPRMRPGAAAHIRRHAEFRIAPACGCVYAPRRRLQPIRSDDEAGQTRPWPTA